MPQPCLLPVAPGALRAWPILNGWDGLVLLQPDVVLSPTLSQNPASSWHGTDGWGMSFHAAPLLEVLTPGCQNALRQLARRRLPYEQLVPAESGCIIEPADMGTDCMCRNVVATVLHVCSIGHIVIIGNLPPVIIDRVGAWEFQRVLLTASRLQTPLHPLRAESARSVVCVLLLFKMSIVSVYSMLLMVVSELGAA